MALPALIVLGSGSARAQLSLSSAVDLALRSNPRVLGARDEVRRARAQLAESHDVYVPSASFGSNVGQAYGYLPYPPTLFTGNAGSLVFSASQHYYIESARVGLKAAEMSLRDIGETVAQDTALSFLTLAHNQERAKAIHEQLDDANKLASISQARFDAGQDSRLELTQAKLTAAQLKLGALRADDEVDNERNHLARLIGMPAASLTIDGVFPTAAIPSDAPERPYANDAIAAAFFTAQAKEQQAKGDSRVRFWPNINLVINYTRYATFTDSFKNLEKIYRDPNKPMQSLLTANSAAFGIQVNLPFLDKTRTDKARETAAEAAHAMHDAQNAEMDALDGESKLRHSIDELKAQAEVADLQRDYSQQQLEVLQQQLQSGTGNPNGPQMTPKDEQKARIDERDKYLAVLDAGYQLHQAEVQLLRQMGQLVTWIGVPGPTPNAPVSKIGPGASRTRQTPQR
ncbi:MAG TPA: TolC family protein [Acidobacteriaceae bacterium]|nr:TolC family protein [Acidobacteriaceae bacterium]